MFATELALTLAAATLELEVATALAMEDEDASVEVSVQVSLVDVEVAQLVDKPAGGPAHGTHEPVGHGGVHSVAVDDGIDAAVAPTVIVTGEPLIVTVLSTTEVVTSVSTAVVASVVVAVFKTVVGPACVGL